MHVAQTFLGQKRLRKYFGKIREVLEMPNLIEVQKSSYDLFLNSGDQPQPQEGEGINGVFIAAANEYQPGGAMIAGGGGLYVEAGSTGTTSLGGQAKLRGCSDQLSAALEAFPLDDGDTGYEAAGGPDLTGYAFPNAEDGAQAAAN